MHRHQGEQIEFEFDIQERVFQKHFWPVQEFDIEHNI